MKTAALEEHFRQVKRWAWRHLNLAHPGGRDERSDPAQVILAKTPPRTLAEHRRDEMNAQSATLGAARTAWEAHDKIRITPENNADALFTTHTQHMHKGVQAVTPNIIVHNAEMAVD